MNRFEGIRNASLAPLGSKAISFMTCKKLFILFFMIYFYLHKMVISPLGKITIFAFGRFYTPFFMFSIKFVLYRCEYEENERQGNGEKTFVSCRGVAKV
jgi:hypothetical protein